MKPSELYFSLHLGTDAGERDNVIIITFCPVRCWEERGCLPDGIDDETDRAIDQLIPKDMYVDNGVEQYYYKWITCREETMWASTKSMEDTRTDLVTIGLVENTEMEAFLSECWR